MFRKPHYIALALVGLLTLIVLNLPSHTAARLKLAVGSLFLPLFGLSPASHQLAGKADGALHLRSEVERPLDELRRANQEQQSRAMQADTNSRENDWLHDMVGWQRT